MNGTMHKWLLKSLGSLSLASTVVLLPLLLTGCGESSTGTVTPVPPPPPPPPPAPPAPPPPPPTPVPAPTPTTAGPISALPTQLAALTPTGQVFSNPTAIPVGFGIRRSGAGENLPVGTYSDFRAVLSFPIPDAIPRNAIVQGAQLTLVQLPSNDSATIPGFGDRGRGFFFLDATPHNLAANSVVFQEVRLGAVDNVVSSDFFAPATSGFVALSFTGNVLGGDASAGPRTADVGPGVQRAVSAPGPRFYQVRLQCAKEVWNNQATSVFPSLSTSVSSSASGTASGAPAFQAVAPIAFVVTGTAGVGGTIYTANAGNPATATITLLATNPITVSFSAAGSTFSAFLPTNATTITQSFGALTDLGINVGITFTGTVVTDAANNTASGTFLTGPVNLTLAIPNQTFGYTASFSTSFSTSTSVAGTPANAAGFEISQGATGTCRAEFDKEPATGTGAGPITTARGPRLDITFTVPR
ncbi:hypothetical protein NW832_12240 [Synechococcus sp. R5-16]|uniref:hypothetical protein n=1 Tax=unclassified Synechococcus TaxID=2626047 RepID=UPI0039C35700